jgi:hypothetical protein
MPVASGKQSAFRQSVSWPSVSATDCDRSPELKFNCSVWKLGRSNSRFYRKMHRPICRRLFVRLAERLNYNSLTSRSYLFKLFCGMSSPESIAFESSSSLRRHESLALAGYLLRSTKPPFFQCRTVSARKCKGNRRQFSFPMSGLIGEIGDVQVKSWIFQEASIALRQTLSQRRLE